MDASSPSAQRRTALNNSIKLPTVSQHLPIEKYYTLLTSVLVKFLDSYENCHWDEAYVYGKRYARVAIEVIPLHGYYNTRKYQTNKRDTLRMSNTVLDYLTTVVEKMDYEESERNDKVKAEQLVQQKESLSN